MMNVKRISLRKILPKTTGNTCACNTSWSFSCWAILLATLFLLRLTSTVFCLATSNVALSSSTFPIEPSSSKGGKTIIVSTQKNGGRSTIFPPPSSTSSRSSTEKKRQKSIISIIQSINQDMQSALRSTFLPSGYPTKTPSGYLKYSIWSWIQDLSTQLRSVLATQRILEGVGVGREGATALSALMNYLTRDGCGMIATLLFTSISSSRFRCDIKRWRLIADIAVDIGITLEVAAIAFPTHFFLPMICVGNMCKAICGVAAGACSGPINLYWAKGGSDISDIAAKFGAQHTVTGALGLVFAALFAKSVATVEVWKLWVLYTALTFLHIIANVRCMRLIAFESLNHIRMNIILEQFLQWWDQQTQQEPDNNNDYKSSVSSSATTSATPILSSPTDVRNVEPLFFLPNWLMPTQTTIRKSRVPIFFGETFNDFSRRSKLTSGGEITDTLLYAPSESSLLDAALGDDGYIISAGILSSSLKKKKKQQLCVDVVFRSNATPMDEAKAYLQATLLGRQLKKLENQNMSPKETVQKIAEVEAQVKEDMSIAWNIFCLSCQQAGWDLSRTEIQSMGYEIATAVQHA